MQKLDRTVFWPFKTYFNQSGDEFMINTPGKPMSIYDVPSLMGKTYPRAFAPINIKKGFRVTGIYPFDLEIFKDENLLAARVTDRPDPNIAVIDTEKISDNSDLPDKSTTPCSSKELQTEIDNTCLRQNSLPTTLIKSPEEVRPFPKAGPRKTRGGRRPAKSRILQCLSNGKRQNLHLKLPV